MNNTNEMTLEPATPAGKKRPANYASPQSQEFSLSNAGTLDPRTKGAVRLTVNIRAAVILLVVCGALIFAVRRLHAKQFARTVEFLRARAMKAVEEESPRTAVNLLAQYLNYSGGDAIARDHLARLLPEAASSRMAVERAYDINDAILRAEPDRKDVRLRQAELAMNMQRIADLDEHLAILREQDSENSRVWTLSAESLIQQKREKEAIPFLEAATACPDPDPEAFTHWADALEATYASAAEIHETLQGIEQCTERASALRERGAWYYRKRNWDQAAQDLWNAEQHEAGHLPTLTRLIDAWKQRESTAAAPTVDALLQHLDHVQILEPRRPEPALLHAYVLSTGQRAAEAIPVLQDAVRRMPAFYELHQMLMELHLRLHQEEEASAILSALPATGLPPGIRHFIQGRILMEQRRWEEAAGSFERARVYTSTDKELQNRTMLMLGLCRSRTGESAAAMEAYRTVMRFGRTGSAGQLGLAATLHHDGQTDLAIAEYSQLTHLPGVAPYVAWLMLQRELKKPQAARVWTDVVDLLRPDGPIRDRVQRDFLRADVDFARGYPLQAVQGLLGLARDLPNHPDVTAGLHDLMSKQDQSVMTALQMQLAADPRNQESVNAIASIRTFVDPAAGALWLEDYVSGNQYTAASEADRALTAARAAAVLARQFRITTRKSSAAIMNETAVKLYQKVLRSQPSALPEAAAVLMRGLGGERAFASLRTFCHGMPPGAAAAAWLEAARVLPANDPLIASIDREIRTLIASNPDDPSLRIASAETLLIQDNPQAAMKEYEEIATVTGDLPLLHARIAWLETVLTPDAQAHDQRSLYAVAMTPADPIALMARARSLLVNRRWEEAERVSRRAYDQHRRPEFALYLAAACFEAGQPEAGREALSGLQVGVTDSALLPPDRRLLRVLLDSHDSSAPRD